MSLDFQLTVFTDPQGEAAAKVYVVAVPTRDATDDELAAYRLSGTIVGPTCKYSSTLQTKIPFRHRGFTQCGRRTALLAEATVADPCYWSPELPFLYRAVGEVTGNATGAQPFDQVFGIRSIGTSRNRLTFNGKVWVPRIIDRLHIEEIPNWQDWRSSSAVMLIDETDESLCHGADVEGVPLMAVVPETDDVAAADALLRWSRHPSVLLVGFLHPNGYGRELRTTARNILLGCSGDRLGMGSLQETVGFLIAVHTGSGLLNVESQQTTGLPVLACQPIEKPVALSAARAECDRLQRDLARSGEFAGYIV